MITTKAELNKAVNALQLPVGCDREPVRKLVELITGVNLTRRRISLGMKLRINGEPCMLVAGDAWKMCIISTVTGARKGNTVPVFTPPTPTSSVFGSVWRDLPYSVLEAMLGDKYRGATIEWL